MAKFLNTSATNYYLEELIKNAKERLVLISPFLKLNDRMRELLADKKRLKMDVQIVYGKTELVPEEMNWLKTQPHILISFCKNLHAKCYLSERHCIVTSLNLYEFSQVNNNEMGILISRKDDMELYNDAHEEAQRIIRISEESTERVSVKLPEQKIKPIIKNNSSDKLTSSNLAKKLGIKTDDFMEKLVNLGYLEIRDDKHYLTQKGKTAGGEFCTGQYGTYFLWSVDFKPDEIKKLRTIELAKKLGITRDTLIGYLKELEYVEIGDDATYLTEKGKLAGGEVFSDQSGSYFLWGEDVFLDVVQLEVGHEIGFRLPYRLG
jgi:Mn-dependent DtxR family transcriptional regulator